MIYGSASHKGCIRQLNEDSFSARLGKPGVEFALVADGMGGHNAGEIASGMVVEDVSEYMRSHDAPAIIALRESIAKANDKVYEAASKRSDYTGMGTTVTLAILDRQEVAVANVGDSRAYHYSPKKKKLVQITRDHSLAEELIAAGRLKKEELSTYAYRNVITRAIGTSPTVAPDIFIQPWEENEILLLCTDGLTIHVSPEEIRQILKKRYSAQQMCDELVQKTIQAGGKDNVTVLIVINSDKGDAR